MESKEKTKWGTRAWIAENPWTKMDRRTRRRVCAVLPTGFAEAAAEAAEAVDGLGAFVRGPAFGASARAAHAEARRRVDALLDAVVAGLLTAVWRVR